MKQNRGRVSLLGIILGLFWGIIIIFTVYSFEQMNKEEKYVPDIEYIVDMLDRREYSDFRERVFSLKEGSEETTEIHEEIYAVSDYIDGLVFSYAYALGGDSEMCDYYSEKSENGVYETVRLYFTIDEISNRFLADK